MSEEQLNASLDAGDAKLVEEEAEDVELTDEELAGVAGGANKIGGEGQQYDSLDPTLTKIRF
jgi:hypothetical protein